MSRNKKEAAAAKQRLPKETSHMTRQASKPRNGKSTTKPGQPLAVQQPSILSLIKNMIDGGVTGDNVEAVTKLIDLQERHLNKIAEQEFNKDFAALQAELPKFEATVSVPDKQGNIKYKYAPFHELMGQIRPMALRFGFAIAFDSRSEGEHKMVESMIVSHKGGHGKTFTFAIRTAGGPPHATPQQGDLSARSHAKRALVCDAFNLVIERDDDARGLGEPIGRALAEELWSLVLQTKTSHKDFLEWCGVTMSPEPTIEDYDIIPDAKFDAALAFLKKKAGIRV